ncbi:MAG: hypothetical protein ASARMPREDX12_008113 [Alectoria sarmentosa]|nr:MAG: hypothetical protein ASARMPREDX12_008113 [Alectoria sarmentosa]
MFSPSHLPEPLSHALEPSSFSGSNTQKQVTNPPRIPSRSMSVRSLLENAPVETPPNSRNTSFGDSQAAEAPHTPLPDLASLSVNGSAVDISDAEVISPGAARLNSVRHRDDANGDDEGVWAALAAEASQLLLAENGNIKKDVAQISNAADILLQFRHMSDNLNVVSELLGPSPSKCKVCTIERLCTDCLQVSWRQRARTVSTPTVVEDESEDEDPRLSTARKIGFSTSCHGNHLQHSAHEGDAVFDLLSLSSRGNQRFGFNHQNRELHDGEKKCRRCGLVQDPTRVRYVEGYRKLGYERFEREDTVSVDDDDDNAMDSRQHGRHGSAEYGGEVSSRHPKLSQKTIERLEREKREWRPESNTSTATSSDTSVTVAGVIESIRPPLYAEESTTRASANTSTVTDPEATPEPNASTSPPPSSSRRLTCRDQRTGVTYPLASDFLNLTTTSSSQPPPPPPSTRQTRPKKAKPSPLKQVETAFETHPAPIGRGGPVRTTARVSKPHSSMQSTRGTRMTAWAHTRRAEFTHEWVRLSAPIPTPLQDRMGNVAAAKAQRGPWTPRKLTGMAPLMTPPTTGRKRKAATQAVEVEEGKGKGKRETEREGKGGASAMHR